MSLNLQPDETPTDQPGTKEGYGRLPVGDTQATCKEKAASQGGYAWDEHAMACWLIYGKAVTIGDLQHSIMEGFEVVNFNFRANGSAVPAPTQNDLPGPVEGGGLTGPGGEIKSA